MKQLSSQGTQQDIFRASEGIQSTSFHVLFHDNWNQSTKDSFNNVIIDVLVVVLISITRRSGEEALVGFRLMKPAAVEILAKERSTARILCE